MRNSPFAALPFAMSAPLLVLLGACVGPAPRPPAPTAESAPRPAPSTPRRPMPASPTPMSTTAAPATTEWQYRPATPGTWTYRVDAAGSAALFGAVSGATAADSAFTIRCDRAGRLVSLSRTGAGQGPMIVRTSYGATTWPVMAPPATGTATRTAAVRTASDPVLDQIAYSRGRFAVDVKGLDMLIVPAWAEISRVIEDCRE